MKAWNIQCGAEKLAAELRKDPHPQYCHHYHQKKNMVFGPLLRFLEVILTEKIFSTSSIHIVV